MINIFKGQFETALLEELDKFGVQKSFKAGETIIDYGKIIRSMPIVLKGTIKVLKMDAEGREILLYYLSDSENCSMAYTCCTNARKSEVKAIAEDDAQLLLIPHNKLDEWLCKYPSWKNYIMNSFNQRLMDLFKTVENIAFKNLDERLIKYLLEKQKLGRSTIIKVSHQQIAEEMASSRVVISRLLKHLENDEKVILYRNEIKLLSKFFIGL
ncbi:MAG: Crp/Fnr family transcriptional regulator [Saprospiraceae bacterium]|nr:Crp/Fnr family transcriptional regulator [Saprospiraceae bacterium]